MNKNLYLDKIFLLNQNCIVYNFYNQKFHNKIIVIDSEYLNCLYLAFKL